MPTETFYDYDDVLREIRGGKRFRVTGSMLLISIAVFMFVFFLWAALAEIDEVTRGQGKVVPTSQIQIIQSYEGGIVQKLLVRQGAVVQKGEVLMELDQTERQGDLNRARQQYFAYSATAQRLQAEIDNKPLVFTDDLIANIPGTVASETALFQSRRDGLASELRVLDGQYFQSQQELEEARVAHATATQQLTSANAELEIIAPLVARGLEAKVSLLQLQRSVNELEGKRTSAALAIERLNSVMREVQDKRKAAEEQYRADALTTLSETTTKINEVQHLMPSVADKLARTEIRSPVRGIVNRLHVTTVGGVAQPGQPLLEVVPTDDTLLVEAYIKPIDIAFLRPGQDVKVKITAYDYSRYGALDGKLETIGADAIRMPESEETLYPVRVRTMSTLNDVDGKPLDIIPGMVAEIDILSGKKSILDYVTKPITRVKDRALRD